MFAFLREVYVEISEAIGNIRGEPMEREHSGGRMYERYKERARERTHINLPPDLGKYKTPKQDVIEGTYRVLDKE